MAPTAQIRRVLIANRGEIARRIIRTCHRLGIETVAAYSDVDRYSPHVREATSSVCIGAPDAYLSVEIIIAAAKASLADAIHPGYGFLSENPSLPEACAKHAICFIGPSADTMRALGSKTAAKSLAQGANVPTAPTLLFSSDPKQPLATQLAAFAQRVGYPVVLKAAAGGGGRGMRFITPNSDAALEIESAQREAQKAFGSPEIFAERCITPARHVEVQVAADAHGEVVALGTRDCTLQRSNQKMIEEAPAAGLPQGLTEELCDAACRLAKAAKYQNLGTVEFLVSPEGGFYFLEVNTRLQVEHPVTEMVTGLDLVELQVRIAEGRRLNECGVSGTPKPNGHAIEARLCAEDYVGQFVLSAGIVQEFEVPTRESAGASVRVDAGVEACSEVTHYYDSLIAKVIVHAPDRAAAVEALRKALSRTRVSGIRTNRGTLLHLLASQPFLSLSHSIQGTAALLPSDAERRAQVVLAHAIAATYRALKPLSPWAASSPWLAITGDARSMSYPWRTVSSGITVASRTTVTESGAQVECRAGEHHVTHSCAVHDLFPAQPDGDNVRLHVDSSPHATRAAVRRDGNTYWVHLDSGTVALEERMREAAAHHGPGAHAGREIAAHIPGKVAALVAKIGDHVTAGQVILVLDSMKMEHPIKAPNAGVVKDLPAHAGSIVQAGSLLAIIEDD